MKKLARESMNSRISEGLQDCRFVCFDEPMLFAEATILRTAADEETRALGEIETSAPRSFTGEDSGILYLGDEPGLASPDDESSIFFSEHEPRPRLSGDSDTDVLSLGDETFRLNAPAYSPSEESGVIALADDSSLDLSLPQDSQVISLDDPSELELSDDDGSQVIALEDEREDSDDGSQIIALEELPAFDQEGEAMLDLGSGSQVIALEEQPDYSAEGEVLEEPTKPRNWFMRGLSALLFSSEF
jgi:hypothetical protein